MVFITGATGLLGSHLLVELLQGGKTVRALKRESSSFVTVKKLFKHYFGAEWQLWFDKIEWVTGDILDIPSLEKNINGCEKVFHCAGFVSFKKRDFKLLMKINKEGTANVVNVCLAFGVKQLCHVSSTAAIGRADGKQDYDETNKWVTTKENSNYAISKYSAENEVWRGMHEGLDVVIINPSVILGAGNWNESSLTLFKAVKKGLKFYTPGTNAFVDARDVAKVFCQLSDKNIINERFLVISENLPFKTLFEQVAGALNVKPPKYLVKSWMAGLAWRIEGVLAFLFKKNQNITKETARSAMMTTNYSNEKIRKALDYKFIPIKQSVEDAVTFFNKNN